LHDTSHEEEQQTLVSYTGFVVRILEQIKYNVYACIRENRAEEEIMVCVGLVEYKKMNHHVQITLNF